MFSVLSLSNPTPRKRSSHKRSREGCLACKARKMKCDEVKPICQNCSKHFGELSACEYGPAKSTKAIAVIGKKPSVTPERSPSTESSEDQRLACQPSLPSSIAAGLLDPFRTHPPTIVKGVDFSMKYYLETALYNSFPWQPPSATNPTTTYFVPLVLSDTVLFHATLQLTFVWFKARCTQMPEVNGSQLVAETIRLLKERVETEDEKSGSSVSDQTISAVTIMAAIDHERGNLKMLKMHIEGLKKMVVIRGGLNAIRDSNRMVANRVFWMFVVAMYESPFPPLDPILYPFFPGDHSLMSAFVTSHFEDVVPGSSDPPSTKYTMLGLIQPVAAVLNSVQHVSQLVPTQDAYTSASTSLVILTRLCTLLSYLLSLPPVRSLLPVDDSDETVFTASMSESARLAILLYIFTPWSGLPPDGTLTISHFLHKLIESLRGLLGSPLLKIDVLVLWIFAIGGVASAGLPERRWFARHFRDMVDEMAIKSWEDMKGALSQGIWHEKLCEHRHRLLWEDVVASRKQLDFA